MLAVVLPDSNGSYAYYLEDKSCCNSGCVTHHRNTLFQIIRDNKFNLKSPEQKQCVTGSTIWYGDCSYIAAVKWSDFKLNPDKYIEAAYQRQDNIDSYNITKEITA